MTNAEVRRKLILFIPLVTFILGLTVTFVLWRTSDHNERAADKRAVEIQAANTRREIETNIKERVLALERMTERWVTRPDGTPENEWQSDAQKYIKDFGGFQAIEWVSADFKTHWISPSAANETLAALNSEAEQQRRETLETARRQLKTIVSRTFEVSPNDPGFLVCLPIDRSGNFEGYIVGVFRTKTTLDNILGKTVAEKYSVIALEGEKEIYRSSGEAVAADAFWSIAGDVNLYNVNWKTTLAPKPQTLNALNSTGSKTTLIVGGGVSFLLALAVFLMQKAQRQSQKTMAANIELERAQTGLSRSEKYNRSLVEKSLGFISTCDFEGRFISINRAGAHALGYEPNEIIGRQITDFTAVEDQQSVSDYFAQVCREREATMLLTFLTGRGEPRVWKCSHALNGETGENQHILGYAQDVTELKNIEKALEKSRLIFERFMNNSPAVSYIKDDTGKFVYASRQMSELFNVPLEEIYGKTDGDFLPLEAAREIRRKEQRIIESGVMEEMLDDILMLDGAIHTWQSYKFPVEDGIGGHLVGGISFDISERRRMEMLLKETATVQRAILNSANYTVISTDAEGVIQTFNQTAERWLGYTSEEIVGKHTPAIIHVAEEVAARARALTVELGRVVEPGFEAFVAKTRTETVDENEWTYRRKDGTEFPVLLSITALRDENGEITGYLGIGSDITERRQMESDLKNARDAALESARIKSEFLANMSHEIRTPMNGIMGMTEILLDTSLDEFQRSCAETVRHSSDALLTIINDILDFSKIEAGKLRFETIDFNLQNTVENSVELFTEAAANKQLALSAQIDRDVTNELRGDPGRVRQILTNLIGNAVKFTENGEIRVQIEKISETARSFRLRFSISDTGIGIKPEAQKYLFQAFTQADGSMTRKFGGTGLGLTISKQLIEMMHGEISVESEPDKGSTFIFTAEFEKQVSGGISQSVPLRNLKNLRVLIVDENEANRKILLHQIARFGLTADEAENASTALKLLQSSRKSNDLYDLAILDLTDSQENGFEIVELIRSDDAFSDVRLILISSVGQHGHERAAREIGIAGQLTKPVKQADLFKCIASVMGESGNHTRSETRTPSVIRPLEKILDPDSVRILVAEDNPVNRTLASLQLKRLGYCADVVENGRLAVQALKNKNYSLILMDCQMPEMDGYAATAEIRRSERNGRHIPVIAVTANAMQGIKEKCIASGMDDYLAKPFKQKELQQIISRWMQSDPPAANDFNNALQETAADLLTPDEIKAELDETVKARLDELETEIGKEEIGMIVELFRVDSAVRLANLQEAIAGKNIAQIEFEAHRLKGGCSNIGADYLADLCEQIEMEAINGQSAGTAGLIVKFTRFYPHLIEILSEVRT